MTTEWKIYKKINNIIIGEKLYFLYNYATRGGTLPMIYHYGIVDSEHKLTDNEICCAAVDIRELKNYKDMDSLKVFIDPAKEVTPLFEEALRKGYITAL